MGELSDNPGNPLVCRLDSYLERTKGEGGWLLKHLNKKIEQTNPEHRAEFARLAQIALDYWEQLFFPQGESQSKERVAAYESVQNSYLFQQQGWKTVIDSLYDSDSPLINLGNGFSFKKTVDFWGHRESLCSAFIDHPFDRTVLEYVSTDDGGLRSTSAFGWRHRRDRTLEQLSNTLRDSYCELHKLFSNDEEYMKRFNSSGSGLAVLIARQQVLDDGFRDYNREEKVISAPLENIPKLLENEGKMTFNRMEFYNGPLRLTLGGKPGFYTCGNWGPQMGFVSVYIGNGKYGGEDYSKSPIIKEWMNKLVGETSIFAEDKFLQLNSAFRNLL
jgi:hypothetical protein